MASEAQETMDRQAAAAQARDLVDRLDKLDALRTAAEELFDEAAGELRGVQAQLALFDADGVDGRVAA